MKTEMHNKTHTDKMDKDKIHPKTLLSYFNRDTNPLKETEFTVQIYGIYSLPEEYARINDATPDYLTQVKISELIFSDVKYNIRQPTEEELKKIEDEKNKKKPPAKGKVEEPCAEELKRIEKELQEKEEKQRVFMEGILFVSKLKIINLIEWNALSDKERFHRTKEDPTKEAWISYQSKNPNSILKKDHSLIEFDEDVNTNKGFFLEFNKIPNPDEDPKKKKPPPKTALPEDLKPLYLISWVNLSEFLLPGTTQIIQRCPLILKETYEKGEKPLDFNSAYKNTEDRDKGDVINKVENKVNTSAKKKDDDKNASKKSIRSVNVNEKGEKLDAFQHSKTYIYLKITTSNAINP